MAVIEVPSNAQPTTSGAAMVQTASQKEHPEANISQVEVREVPLTVVSDSIEAAGAGGQAARTFLRASARMLENSLQQARDAEARAIEQANNYRTCLENERQTTARLEERLKAGASSSLQAQVTLAIGSALLGAGFSGFLPLTSQLWILSIPGGILLLVGFYFGSRGKTE